MSNSNGAVVTFIRAVDAISDWSGKLFSWIIWIIVVVVLVEVMLRYLFNAPTIWANELSTMLFGAYFMLVGAYCVRHDFHVRVDVFYRLFSPRTRAILDLFTSILFYLFLGTLLWKGWDIAWDSLMVREVSESVWAPPLYPVRMVIPVSAFLMLLQGLANSIRNFMMVMARL